MKQDGMWKHAPICGRFPVNQQRAINVVWCLPVMLMRQLAISNKTRYTIGGPTLQES